MSPQIVVLLLFTLFIKKKKKKVPHRLLAIKQPERQDMSLYVCVCMRAWGMTAQRERVRTTASRRAVYSNTVSSPVNVWS